MMITVFEITIALAKVVNSGGLILDIVGAIILFRFGLPEEISRTGSSALLLEGTDEDEITKAKQYDRNSHIGVFLLIAGFVLQLISNFV